MNGNGIMMTRQGVCSLWMLRAFCKMQWRCCLHAHNTKSQQVSAAAGFMTGVRPGVACR